MGSSCGWVLAAQGAGNVVATLKAAAAGPRPPPKGVSRRECVLVRGRAVGVGHRVQVQVLLPRHRGIGGAGLARRVLRPARDRVKKDRGRQAVAQPPELVRPAECAFS